MILPETILYLLRIHLRVRKSYIIIQRNSPTGNCPSVPRNDYDSTFTTQSVTIDILNNDEICDSFKVDLEKPAIGTAHLNAKNQVVYEPKKSFIGKEEFSYSLCTQDGNICNKARIVINVNDEWKDKDCKEVFNPKNDGGSVSTSSQLKFSIDRLLENDESCPNDIDKGTFTIKKSPQYHKEFIWRPDELVYKSKHSYTGNDTITYEVCTYTGVCKTADIIIEVTDN